MGDLRALSVTQQVGLLFVTIFGLLTLDDPGRAESIAARAHGRAAVDVPALSPRPARGLGRHAAVLDRLGIRRVRLDPGLRRAVVPRACASS
jgi:hypothetical protein